MGRDSETNEKNEVANSETVPPKPVKDDPEDGDIATPKRGIDGDDDQPL